MRHAGLFAVAASPLHAQLLYDDLRKDPQKDLVPVVNASKADMIMVVSPGLQAKTLQEVIALAKARPKIAERGVQAGLDVDYLSSADLQKRIVADSAIRSEVIRNAQIKVN